jgi:hypothetical protein
MTTAYEELLDRAKELSSAERLRLADALLAEELGFGMWAQRADIQDAPDNGLVIILDDVGMGGQRADGYGAAAYVERIRDASMRTPDNRLKSPDEFLKEVEDFDE